MVSFDTNVLVYATASISDAKVMRARDVIARAIPETATTMRETINTRSLKVAAFCNVVGPAHSKIFQFGRRRQLAHLAGNGRNMGGPSR